MSNLNWWVDAAPISVPGGTTVGGGGYGAQGINYRDPLDARRSLAGQESQYPDGYLGTIVDRQQDKLLAKVQERLTDRSYQRGVHVGSKIGQAQYHWTAEVNPDAGLERQAATAVPISPNLIGTARYSPQCDPTERLAHLGKNAVTSPEALGLARQFGVPGSLSTSQLQTLLPPWAV